MTESMKALIELVINSLKLRVGLKRSKNHRLSTKESTTMDPLSSVHIHAILKEHIGFPGKAKRKSKKFTD